MPARPHPPVATPKNQNGNANGKTGLRRTAWGDMAPIQPWVRVEDVEEASGFYQQLGFKQNFALPNPDGTWAWAALSYGECNFMISPLEAPTGLDKKREKKTQKGPRGLGVRFYLNVPDVNRAYDLCRAHGLTFTSEMHDEFWGDRCFSVLDPYGYEWTFAQHVKDLTPDEIAWAAGFH